ncbi:MAG TPA: phosphodiester glycosidase family protein [Gaiellaceae bacterium]|nr:phosphodiester glycosidase family protein [Gaiellaceae bacterium]
MTRSAQDEQHRLERRRRLLRRRLRRRLVLAVLGAVLAPVLYSYITTMTKPSSLPLSIRSIEWVRANHGAWLVDTVEHYWYSWTAPAPGGPTLKALPAVGVSARSTGKRTGPTQRTVRAYRPPRIASVLRPALPGEGVWQATGLLVRGRPPVFVTTFRPDRVYPRVVAYVAWIDHTRTQLALYPGRYEPPGASPRGPMEVPVSQRARLLATFNSGFTYADGHGGFAVDGQTVKPLQDGMGTVVAYRDGHVDVTTWHGGAQLPRWLVLARQNLPLIVDGGKPNPTLDDSSRWGDTLGSAVRVWRSGVGIDRHGNLIYAAADFQTVRTLAALLIHAGAVRAIELDINPEWPSFITYSSPGGLDPIKLVPNYQQPATRYLVPDDRDFFAVFTRRAGASGFVPFR